MQHGQARQDQPLLGDLGDESPARLVAPLAAPHEGQVLGPHPVARAIAGLLVGAAAGAAAAALTPRQARTRRSGPRRRSREASR